MREAREALEKDDVDVKQAAEIEAKVKAAADEAANLEMAAAEKFMADQMAEMQEVVDKSTNKI